MSARLLVTGATGFLGGHVLEALKGSGYVVMGVGKTTVNRGDRMLLGYDLRRYDEVDTLFRNFRPDEVLHLAGYNGGIRLNADEPAKIFYDNTVMGLNVLRACEEYEVGKVVSVVASCAYPFELPYADGNILDMADLGVMEEQDFLREQPHPSVACHGYAKRNLFLAAGFFRQQFGLNAVTVCPTTLYGPNDSYDPRRTKVMGGMVRRFVDAADNGIKEVTCWGSGNPLREFMYVEDCAKLLVRTLRQYDGGGLLNLGSGHEVSIKDAAELVAAVVGYQGKILWDTSKPSGQLRKRLDTKRMQEVFPDFIPTPLENGISRTVADYRHLCRRSKGAAA